MLEFTISNAEKSASTESTVTAGCNGHYMASCSSSPFLGPVQVLLMSHFSAYIEAHLYEVSDLRGLCTQYSVFTPHLISCNIHCLWSSETTKKLATEKMEPSKFCICVLNSFFSTGFIEFPPAVSGKDTKVKMILTCSDMVNFF